MHGLANYAHRLGIAPKMDPTRRFAVIFWKNIAKSGRVNEFELSLRPYFMDGFMNGIKKGLAMAGVGLGILKTKRPQPLWSGGAQGHQGQGRSAQDAEEGLRIENKRKGFAS